MSADLNSHGAQSDVAARFAAKSAEQVPAPRTKVAAFSSIERQQIEYVLPGLPIGRATLLGGDGGLGKSMLTAHWASRISRGSLLQPAGNVLIVNAEDDPASTTRPRLEAAGADLDRVFTIEAGGEDDDLSLKLPADLDVISAAIEEHGVRLLILDPITAFFDGELNYSHDPDVRQVVSPINALARRHNLAAVIVGHLNKRETSNAAQRLGGSLAFFNAARNAFLLTRDPDDPEGDTGSQRVLAHIKSNDGLLRSSTVYRINQVTLDGEHDTATIVHHGESDLSGDDLLDRLRQTKRGPTKAETAELMLREILGDKKWHPVDDVKQAIKDAGVSVPTIE